MKESATSKETDGKLIEFNDRLARFKDSVPTLQQLLQLQREIDVWSQADLEKVEENSPIAAELSSEIANLANEKLDLNLRDWTEQISEFGELNKTVTEPEQAETNPGTEPTRKMTAREMLGPKPQPERDKEVSELTTKIRQKLEESKNAFRWLSEKFSHEVEHAIDADHLWVWGQKWEAVMEGIRINLEDSTELLNRGLAGQPVEEQLEKWGRLLKTVEEVLALINQSYTELDKEHKHLEEVTLGLEKELSGLETQFMLRTDELKEMQELLDEKLTKLKKLEANQTSLEEAVTAGKRELDHLSTEWNKVRSATLKDRVEKWKKLVDVLKIHLDSTRRNLATADREIAVAEILKKTSQKPREQFIDIAPGDIEEEQSEDKTKIEEKVGRELWEMFGLDDKNVAEAKLDELTPGQQRLVLENMKQIGLGIIEEDAQALLAGKSRWKQLFTRISKVKQEATDDLKYKRSNKEFFGQVIEGVKKSGIDAEINKEGNLEILFAPAEYKELNAAASAFAKIPYEWSLSSATKKERAVWNSSHDAYLKELASAKEKGLSNADALNQKVWSQQFMSNHPEIEKKLAEIKDDDLWKSVFHKSAYFGLGYYGRSLAANALESATGPLVAGVMGALRGRRRAAEATRKLEIESRRGRQRKHEAVDRITTADSLSKKLNGLIASVQKKNDSGESPEKELAALDARIKYTEKILHDGRIDFGMTKNRVANQYRLLESLSLAHGFDAMPSTGEANKTAGEKTYRVTKFIEDRKGRLKSRQLWFRDKQMLKGLAWGVGLGMLGQAAHWFWSSVDEGAGVIADSEIPEIESAPRPHAAGVAPRLEPFTPPDTEIEVPETDSTGIEISEIKEGGSAWQAAKDLVKEGKITNREFLDAWSNKESLVRLPDSTEVHISDLDLTHAGDKIEYVPGENGNPGHFEFEETSGLKHGTELPKPVSPPEVLPQEIVEPPAELLPETPLQEPMLESPSTIPNTTNLNEYLPTYKTHFEREMLGGLRINYKTWVEQAKHIKVADIMKDPLPKSRLPLKELSYLIRAFEPYAPDKIPEKILKMNLSEWLDKAAREDMQEAMRAAVHNARKM